MGTNYLQVELEIIKHWNQILDFDLFLKMSEQKFVKIYRQGDPLNWEILNKIAEKNPHSLFINDQDQSRYLMIKENKNQNQSQKKDDPKVLPAERSADKSKDPKIIKAISLASDYNALKETLCKVGINPQALESIQKVNRESLQLIQQNPILENLLELRQNSLPHAHALMVSYIAGSAAAIINKSETSRQMISMAAFLHEITLTEDEIIGWLKQTPEAIISKKNKNHPIEAAEYASLCSNRPQDLKKIIIQHHETCDGQGFPYKISYGDISPISATFILADRFVDDIILSDMGSEVVSKTLEYLSGRFNNNYVFKQAFEALKKVLQSK